MTTPSRSVWYLYTIQGGDPKDCLSIKNIPGVRDLRILSAHMIAIDLANHDPDAFSDIVWQKTTGRVHLKHGI